MPVKWYRDRCSRARTNCISRCHSLRVCIAVGVDIHTSAALVLAHFNCAMLRIFLDCDLRDLPSKGTNRIEVGISPERYHNVEPARPASLEVNGQPHLLQNFPQSLGSCLHLAKVFA